MTKYVLVLMAICSAVAADPIFYASSTNTWSMPLDLSISLHAEGSYSTEYTGYAACGWYSDCLFGYSVAVPTVTLPPGAVVLSDELFALHDATVTNQSQAISTVPVDPSQPDTPWIFRGGWFWAVWCSYGGDPSGLCAYNQNNPLLLSPPFPDQLAGTFHISWVSGDGPGADHGLNAISDASITTNYLLTVEAYHLVEYSLPIPEPASAVVLGLGLLCLGVLRKRRTLQ